MTDELREMVVFQTGATRDQSTGKPDFEGFLSPAVLERFGTYMHGHRVQADGTLRDSDNWQRGIPIEAYQSSLVRHLFQAWSVWRGNPTVDDQGKPVDLEEALCAVLFNVQGYLHELLKCSA